MYNMVAEEHVEGGAGMVVPTALNTLGVGMDDVTEDCIRRAVLKNRPTLATKDARRDFKLLRHT